MGCTLILEADMGWLRSVGAIQLYVSFEEYSLFYRALLQKRTMFLGSLLIVATPYGVATISDFLNVLVSPSIKSHTNWALLL